MLKLLRGFALILFLPVISFCQNGADSLLDFISTNRNRSSIYILKNDTIIARLNENKLMPLASTVKMLIAVEFAKQAGKNIFSETEYIALSELDKYYLPFTDGGAHTAWLKYEKSKEHIKEDSVRLIDIARGMIMFSSNANAEFILDFLGLDNVKNNIQLFSLAHHTAIFPPVSSLFLYQNPKKIKESTILRAMKDWPEEAYCKTIFEIHKALKYDTVLKKKFNLGDLTTGMQKLWSDKLTASTTKDYVHLCNILNNRRFLDDDSYGVLVEVLESMMENPRNKDIYKHIGIKNGSTSFVLTEALYVTMKNNDRIEAAYFFNELSAEENKKLQQWLNDFRIHITQQEIFRKKITLLFH
jgi:D-alanyl-D-alanine carboxypeptidase